MHDALFTSRPAARVDGLVMTEAGSGLLVYVDETKQLHHLDALSTTVWRLLDGSRSPADILAAVGESDGKPVTGESIELAITHLAEIGLLDAGTALPSFASSQSRRKLLKKVGIAAAVPAIVSITAPMAAAAASCSVQTFCTEIGEPCCGLQNPDGSLIALETGICELGILDLVVCIAVGV